jgi:hypothetical protein
MPTDPGDGNLLRAQTAAAGLAVNAQLRADETKMKPVRGTDDALERLKAIIAEEEALAEERRKLWEREGLAAARADIVGTSTWPLCPRRTRTIAPSRRSGSQIRPGPHIELGQSTAWPGTAMGALPSTGGIPHVPVE